MGMVYAEITLKNAGDVRMAWEGLIPEAAVREATVRALVDTGAGTVVMGEELCLQLGLSIEGLRGVTLAGGERMVGRRTEAVDIHWKDRSATFRALVLPGEHQVLLGAIPLEDMDLIVDPKRQELVGAHGDEILTRV